MYSPINRIIKRDTRGIYILNNEKAVSWVNDQNELDKFMRESEIFMSKIFERNRKKMLHSRLVKVRSNKIETEEVLLDDDHNARHMNLYYEDGKEVDSIGGALLTERVNSIYLNKTKESRMDSSHRITTKISSNIDHIISSLDTLYENKLQYKAHVKTDVLDWNTSLVGELENHIIICGFKEGVSYYIEAIRNSTDVPILLIANAKWEINIKKLYTKYNNVIYFKGEPTEINCLQSANVAKAQHVIILTSQEDNKSKIDNDGVMIANYLQETYPQVKFWVEVMHQCSTQLISYSIFSNRHNDLAPCFSLSFMTGKVLDTTLFYKIGSLLRTSPLDIDFIINLMQEIPGKNRLIPLYVNDYLSGKTYKEVYYDFLTDPAVNLLTFGVFSWQLGQEINKKIKRIFLEKEDVTSTALYIKDNADDEPDYIKDSDIDRWLLSKIPVFKLLDPESKYILVQGDILYCYGQVSEELIANYLWQKKFEETEKQNSNSENVQTEISTEEEIVKHNKRVEQLLDQLRSRLIREVPSRQNNFIEVTKF